MKIAVVGAGIAGLACARALVDRGHAVTVFERGDVPGGRVATMRTEIGGFDHGAQYFTARDAAFVEAVDRWSHAGIAEPWPVAPRSIGADASDDPIVRPASGHTARWVGVPGMAAIPHAMADGLDVRCGATVLSIDAVAGGGPARWRVRTVESGDVVTSAAGDGAASGIDAADGTSSTHAGIASRGEAGGLASSGDIVFDAVVVAVPAAPAAALLAMSPSLASRATDARIEPCWALLLGFTEPIESGEQRVGDAAFVEGGRLAWIACESSKPERRVGERWTVHAQSGWSVEHFDDDPEDIKAKLLRAFHDATGTIEQPVYAAVHRWRHALARTSLDDGFLWDVERGVGACGDWCRGYRVEDAWLSGTALADAVCGGSVPIVKS